MPNVDAFEEDREAVVSDFRQGRFDYVEVASRVTEARFFRYLLEEGNLKRLAATYPTPRRKEEVSLWIYLASQLTLRLHGQHAYATYPFILHCGGLRDALGPGQVQLTEDPSTGQRRRRCTGYDDKNHYERRTPCDQDDLRKLARHTRSDALMAWFNRQVAPYLKDLGTYDEEGVFVIDGSYLFVPDDEHYERSARLRFDEHNHPMSRKDYEALPPKQKDRTRWRWCCRAVFLLHLHRQATAYPFVGLALLNGKASETPYLRRLADTFVESVGRGILRTLIFDRGFIDGEAVSHLKKAHGIDSVFPLKSDMLDFQDAQMLADADETPWIEWRPAERPPAPVEGRPAAIRKREEARQRTRAEKASGGAAVPEKVELKMIRDMTLWESATVPIHVVLVRHTKKDGSRAQWCLATTNPNHTPLDVWHLYRDRTDIEERHRQLKCFWDLTDFRSRAFSLVTAQVVFVLLAYSLLQVFCLRRERGELNDKTRKRLLNELLFEDDKIVLYSGNKVAYLTPLEHQELLLTLSEGARRRVLARTRKLRRHLMRPTDLPPRPGL